MTAGTQRSFELLLFAIDDNLTGNYARRRQCSLILAAGVTEPMWHTKLPQQKALLVKEEKDEPKAVGTKPYQRNVQ